MQTRDKTLCIVDHDPLMGETLRNRLGLDGCAPRTDHC